MGTQQAGCALVLKISHRPDGKMADALLLYSRLHNCERFGQLQDVRATETLQSSHRLDGKVAHVLAP